jgi:hypothetical protein
MSHVLSMYVVYDHPKDYPEWFVCRRWDVVEGGSTATDDFTMSMDYESIKTRMEAMGLTKLYRCPTEDDPSIMEVWL